MSATEGHGRIGILFDDGEHHVYEVTSLAKKVRPPSLHPLHL